MKKVLVFIKGFQPIERVKLARMTALWVASGAVPPTVLGVLNNEHLIKDGVALEFLVELFVTLKQERGIPALITALKKGSLEGQLMEFLPLNKRTEENFKKTFDERGLEDIVKLHKNQASQENKRELQSVSPQNFSLFLVHMAETANAFETNLKTLNVCDIKQWPMICLLASGSGRDHPNEKLPKQTRLSVINKDSNKTFSMVPISLELHASADNLVILCRHQFPSRRDKLSNDAKLSEWRFAYID